MILLHKRTGITTRLPGILIDGKLWISTLCPSWLDDLQEAVVNKVLHTDANNETQQSPTFALRLPTHHEGENEDEDFSEHPGDQWVPLPGGSVLSLAELTRRLVQYHERDSTTFTGRRAMNLYKRHFQLENDKATIAFCNVLVDYGVLHVVRTDWTTFANCILQLQATRGLNTLLPPVDRLGNRHWKVIVQELSTMMDAIVTETDSSKRHCMIDKFRVASCALQTVTFRLDDPSTGVESLLQLYNLMVRHFSLQQELPPTLALFLSAQDEYGYFLQGRLLKASELRNWLWRRSTTTRLPTIVYPKKPQQNGVPLLFCRPKDQVDCSFSSRVVKTGDDGPGLLLAMAWSTSATVPFPISLSPEAIARLVCESHVVREGSKLWLPQFVSWFRKDFGESKDDLLDNLAPYSETVRDILANHHCVEIAFGEPPAVTKRSSESEELVDTASESGTVYDHSIYFDDHQHDATCQPSLIFSKNRLTDSIGVGCKAILGESFTEIVPPCYLGGRQPSRGDFAPPNKRQPSRGDFGPSPPKRGGVKVAQPCLFDECHDLTETTVTEDSTSDDDYADWYNYDNISAITFGSSRDVLVNEAYLSNGVVPGSTRSVLL